MSESRAVRAWPERVRALPRATLVAAAIIAFGIVLRTLGYFDLELWADEAKWATILVEGGHNGLRPVGYIWLSRKLVGLAHNEEMLRSLSYASGVLMLPAAHLVLRRIIDNPWVANLGLLLLAVHPMPVSMGKEFKPYIVEACLHVVLLLIALDYRAHPSRTKLTWLIVAFLSAPLFAWTVCFTYPAVVMLVVERLWRDRRYASLASLAGLCVATLAVLWWIYTEKVAKREQSTEFWGQKYDIFYLGDDTRAQLTWLVEKTVDIAKMPWSLHWWWPAPAGGATVVVFLCVAGIVLLLVRRRFAVATLLVTPWLVTLAFNLKDLWPYGPFRTNVYLLFYVIALVCCALDGGIALTVARRPSLERPLLAALAVVALLVVPLDLGWFSLKHRSASVESSSVYAAMKELYEANKQRQPGPRLTLVMDGRACESFRYYRDLYPESRATLGTWYKHHVKTHCTTYRQTGFVRGLKRHRKQTFWLISGHPSFAPLAKKHLDGHCDIDRDLLYDSGTLLLYCKQKTPSPPEAPANGT